MTTLLRRTLLALILAALPAACAPRQGEVSQALVSASQPVRVSPRTGEASVRPGVNEQYADTDVETWVERFESESREIYHHRQEIVDLLRLTPGTRVADIGCGTGFFSVMFAECVGASGMVYAVDIAPAFLERTEQLARKLGLENIRTVQASDDAVNLPPGSVDVVFLCDVYHHLEFPRSTLESISRALRPWGLLWVIDFDRIPGQSRQWVLDHVRAGREQVIREIEAAGFMRVDTPAAPFLRENYVQGFRRGDIRKIRL